MESNCIMIVTARIKPAETEALQRYVEASQQVFKKAGAELQQKYKIGEHFLGDDPLSVVSITSFPSQEVLEQTFASKAYQDLLLDREKAFSYLNVYISTP
ncbi:MAG: DUF1330 domain-containing protein [Saprospiraceae bacterium]|nr:DUF1330 domain-containing protein [Saprospiraceae bacterium]